MIKFVIGAIAIAAFALFIEPYIVQAKRRLGDYYTYQFYYQTKDHP